MTDSTTPDTPATGPDKVSPYTVSKTPRSANLNAFLTTISLSEGTFSEGDGGYNVLVGGQLFHSYADHPRITVDLRDKAGKLIERSTAAGRYQEMAWIYDAYKGPLGLTDFGPDAQDAIAIQLLREVHALPLIERGQIAAAINASASRWASFPKVDGASAYGQPVRKMDMLLKAFVRFGGTLAS